MEQGTAGKQLGVPPGLEGSGSTRGTSNRLLRGAAMAFGQAPMTGSKEGGRGSGAALPLVLVHPQLSEQEEGAKGRGHLWGRWRLRRGVRKSVKLARCRARWGRH